MVKRFLAAALTVLVGSAMAVSVGCDGGVDTKSDKKVQDGDKLHPLANPASPGGGGPGKKGDSNKAE